MDILNNIVQILTETLENNLAILIYDVVIAQLVQKLFKYIKCAYSLVLGSFKDENIND